MKDEEGMKVFKRTGDNETNTTDGLTGTMNTLNRPYQGFLMWLCAATFYGFQFLIRVSPNVMTHQLMAAFDVQACALGVMVSFYYWGYSLMQIPAGLLLDNIGPRRPLVAACLLCFFGCVIFGMGSNIYVLATGRILMGIGSAFGFLTTVRIVSTWFGTERLGLFVGLTLMVGTFGAISGSSPLGALLTLTSWRNCMLILAAFSAILSIAAWKVIRDDDPHGERTKKNYFSLTYVLLSMIEILKNPQTWIYALYGFLMYVPLSGFADLWATPFMEQQFKVDYTTASGGVFSFYVGMSIGAPLWPFFSTWIQSHKKALIISALLTAFFITIAFYQNNLTFFQSCLLLGITGACSGGQFLAFSGVANINSRDRAATASGMHNMICMFSGNLMQPLLGKLLQMNWSERGGTFLAGAPDYNLEDFRFALGIIPIALVMAAFVTFLVKETFPQKSS
ncbi:MAG: MFS transporter [Caedimonas sp.]|jgi:MFS family permease|nr:MFS transporter [Caedimonas sp.]